MPRSGPNKLDAAETHPARGRDISDRAYESAVLDLINNAKESIVISIYTIMPSGKGPVAGLYKALENALERGVSVEIYPNINFGSSRKTPTFWQKPYKRLEEKGAVINPVSKTYILHDKLVIVDSRYVAEGSHNWSAQALKRNRESSTLIDSEALAREKLARVRSFPLEKDRLERIRKHEELMNPPPLAEDTLIPLPRALLEDENLLPRMITEHSKRGFDLYFLLVLRGYTVGRGELPEEFPVSLEELADDLEVPKTWTLRRKRWHKVTELLTQLRDDYGLIDVEFRLGSEEWVAIKKLPGGTFPVGLDFFKADFLNSKTTRAKVVYLLRALLKSEGKRLDSYEREELAEKYHIGLKQLRYGIRELEN